MALSARTHVWPLNVAAPKLPALPAHGIAQLAQQHQPPVQPAQQPQQQAHRPRRPLNRLRLLSLPLELVLSILSFLEPPDLLALSCTSRTFANLLRRSGDRRALKLWTQARLNMEVPELTSDLRAGGDDVAAEVMLARLIGGETCQVCGECARDKHVDEDDDDAPVHVDFALRTRLCCACSTKLCVSRQKLSDDYFHLHPLAFDCSFITTAKQSGGSIGDFHRFVPDVLAVSARLHTIQAQALANGSSPDFASYFKQRCALQDHVDTDARKLRAWKKARAERAAKERAPRVARRDQQVFGKLEALGFNKNSYDHDYFWEESAKVCHEPSVWCEGAVDRQERERRNHLVDEFCTSEEPLDDDQWDLYKDRIVAWVEQNRRDCRERSKDYEQEWQRVHLKPLYPWVQRCVDKETAPFLLPLSSFLRLPSLRIEWEWLGPIRREPYKQHFCRMLPRALADALAAVRNDRLVLLDRLARTLLAEGDPLPPSILFALSSSSSPFVDCDPLLGVEPAYTAIAPADADALLERAVAFFRCGVCGLFAPFAQLIPHVHASHGVRAPPRSLVAPAQVRALVRSAAGATATAEDCEKMGRVWETSGGGVVEGGAGAAGDGGAALRLWKLKGQTWGEVMQHGFHGVSGLKVGRTLRRSTLEGPGAPPAPPARSSADGEKVRLLGFDAGEYTESAWAWP